MGTGYFQKGEAMTMSKTARKILIVAAVVAAVLLAVQAFAGPRPAGTSAGSRWLCQFEGGPVTVTFINEPPDRNQVVTGRLISAELCGLVLRFPNETDKFFCYANITSVNPK
jgi:hypothetical protein